MIPIYTTPARDDRERLARLMERRRAMPEGFTKFPDPPAYLSPHEREVWDEIRGALGPLGVVDAGHFAVVEALACSIASADRLRENYNRTPATAGERRQALLHAIKGQETAAMRGIEFLGLTRAMRVFFASRAPGAIPIDRLDLKQKRR